MCKTSHVHHPQFGVFYCIFNTKTNLLGLLLYDYKQQHKCNFRKRLYSLECEDGKHGQNCTQNCSTYCIGGLCNNVDGSCYCSQENNRHPECKKVSFTLSTWACSIFQFAIHTKYKYIFVENLPISFVFVILF